MSTQSEKNESYYFQLADKLRTSLTDLELNAWNMSDAFLVTWIRRDNCNLKKAEETVRQRIKWQDRFHLESLLLLESFPVELEELFPSNSNGFDKDGWPVYTYRFGQWQIKSALENYDEEVVLRFMVRTFVRIDSMVQSEYFRKLKNEQTILKCNGTIINDLAGLSLNQHASTKCLRVLSALVRAIDGNFPLPDFHIFHLNTNKVTRVFMKLVTPFFRPDTLGQMKWLGSDREDWIHEFSKYLSLEDIPKEFGGTNENMVKCT